METAIYELKLEILHMYMNCMDRRLGGPQSWCGRFGEEKILDPTGTRTPTPRSPSP
jgi:hypothetical protein